MEEDTCAKCAWLINSFNIDFAIKLSSSLTDPAARLGMSWVNEVAMKETELMHYLLTATWINVFSQKLSINSRSPHHKDLTNKQTNKNLKIIITGGILMFRGKMATAEGKEKQIYPSLVRERYIPNTVYCYCILEGNLHNSSGISGLVYNAFNNANMLMQFNLLIAEMPSEKLVTEARRWMWMKCK